jgi:hypothetical protein
MGNQIVLRKKVRRKTKSILLQLTPRVIFRLNSRIYALLSKSKLHQKKTQAQLLDKIHAEVSGLNLAINLKFHQ